MAFELPELPYAYDALAPYMSAETLEFHHDKHHMAYVNKGNEMLEGKDIASKPLEDIVRHAGKNDQALLNQVGQHYNHIHFWQWMKPGGGGTKLPGKLQSAIDSDLGGYDKFKADFTAAGAGQFGSGWCWLAVKDGKIEVMKTANGDNPLTHGAHPILGCDVWEHSYYIDYRNARPKYLEAFVDNLINWEHVEKMYEEATS